MNRVEYNEHIDSVFQEIIKLSREKGGDYSGDEDVLSYFKRNAERLGLTPEQVLGVFLNKHLDAISTFIKDGKVKSEGIHGRIHDAINYLIHLDVMIEEKWQDHVKGVGMNSHSVGCILEPTHGGVCVTGNISSRPAPRPIRDNPQA